MPSLIRVTVFYGAFSGFGYFYKSFGQFKKIRWRLNIFIDQSDAFYLTLLVSTTVL
jgi:hypothetical protein